MAFFRYGALSSAPSPHNICNGGDLILADGHLHGQLVRFEIRIAVLILDGITGYGHLISAVCIHQIVIRILVSSAGIVILLVITAGIVILLSSPVVLSSFLSSPLLLSSGF